MKPKNEPSTQPVKIEPGQVWEWQQPDGRLRRMLVQRLTEGPPRRVWGIHPEKGKKLQVLAAVLTKGLHGARLLYTVENYKWIPVRPA